MSRRHILEAAALSGDDLDDRDPAAQFYVQTARKVVTAVRAWAALNPSADLRWRGFTDGPRVALIGDLSQVLPLTAASEDALALGRYVIANVDEATWLLFEWALTQVYGDDWFLPRGRNGH